MEMTPDIENYFKIAIFVSDYAVGNTPCTVTSAVLLAEAGYDVDILTFKPHDDPAALAFEQDNIRTYDLTGFAEKTTDPENAAIIPDAVLAEAQRIVAARRHVCFIGVEAKGLIFAGLLQEKVNVPLVYFSAELYYTGHPHINPAELARIKPLERKYHARASATIVQDEARGRILCEDNRVQPETIFYVPVGLLGPPVVRREKRFHEMFNLPDREKVLLQFGSIHSYRQSDRIAAMSAGLPEGWTLVLHGFVAPEIVELVKRLPDASRIRLSRGLVDLEDLTRLVASADAGLVFYTDDNLNDYNTGLASDKMARHMQCRTPVITCGFPSFRKVIDTYGCGICVDDPDRVPEALERITAGYDRFVRGAEQAYLEQYEVSRHFSAVLDFLYQATTPPASLKHAVIRRYARAYETPLLIETGTFIGDTLAALRDDFEELYSIELSRPLFEKAKQRFAGDDKIILANGDSARLLPRLLAQVNRPALFWLDGHYSGGMTAKGAKSTPIQEELEAVFSHPVKGHVILIDDARDFNGTDDYPTLAELAAWVRSVDGNRQIRVSGGIIQIVDADHQPGPKTLGEDIERTPSDRFMDVQLFRLAQGAAYFEAGDLDAAEAEFKAIRERRPDDIEALFGLASVQWKKGRPEKARKTLSRVLELAPDDRQAIWNLGQLLKALKMQTDACRVYNFFLARHPGDNPMAEALDAWQAAASADGARRPAHEAECIIFSMDRAMQLHALLSSYFAKVKNPVPLHLFYRATAPAHHRAYDSVLARFENRLASVTLQRETGSNPFRTQLLALLERVAAPKIFFLVDDIVFIEETDLKDFTRFDIRKFVPSLRLGTHLTRCYTLDQPQPLPAFMPGLLPDTDKQCWQWREGQLDWGYPLSVDGHLFATDEIRAMAARIDFTAPNTFELGLQRFNGSFMDRTGVCYRKSKIVNIPCNRVQQDVENRHGDMHQDALMKMFNRGRRIDVSRLYGFVNNGAHQEIPLTFAEQKNQTRRHTRVGQPAETNR